MFKADNTERMNRHNALNHFAIVLQKHCCIRAVILQSLCRRTARRMQ